MSPPSSKATIYLCKFEPDLIELGQQEEQVKSNTVIPVTRDPEGTMATINIKLSDLLNHDLAFDNDKILLTPSTTNQQQFQTENIMQKIDGMEYLERCNQRHTNLLNLVNQTRMQCKNVFLSYY